MKFHFNEINEGRNILINSQHKRILFISRARKNETKLRKTEKTWTKKKPMEVT